jgi:hypothetical protein
MDIDKIAALVMNGSTALGIAKARADAKSKYSSFPKLGCAAYLSSLMRNSGMNVSFTTGSGKLAHILERERGWAMVKVGQQRSGDVGVAFDKDTSIPGADHVYLVLEALDADRMVISDNQDTKPHGRTASSRSGKTRTEYFLRAT